MTSGLPLYHIEILSPSGTVLERCTPPYTSPVNAVRAALEMHKAGQLVRVVDDAGNLIQAEVKDEQ